MNSEYTFCSIYFWALPYFSLLCACISCILCIFWTEKRYKKNESQLKRVAVARSASTLIHPSGRYEYNGKLSSIYITFNIFSWVKNSRYLEVTRRGFIVCNLGMSIISDDCPTILSRFQTTSSVCGDTNVIQERCVPGSACCCCIWSTANTECGWADLTTLLSLGICR